MANANQPQKNAGQGQRQQEQQPQAGQGQQQGIGGGQRKNNEEVGEPVQLPDDQIQQPNREDQQKQDSQQGNKR